MWCFVVAVLRKHLEERKLRMAEYDEVPEAHGLSSWSSVASGVARRLEGAD